MAPIHHTESRPAIGTWRRKPRLERRRIAHEMSQRRNGPVVTVQEASTPLFISPDRKRYASYALRVQVLERDEYSCQYCGAAVTMQTANIDHVRPWIHGGKTALENLVASCRDCNKAKGNNQWKPKTRRSRKVTVA